MAQTLPAPASRTGRKRARTRTQLLVATRDLIADKGVDAATIADITGRADVGFGTFYLHFESKDEAVEAVVAEVVEELGSALDRLTRDLADPAEVLAISVRHVVGRVDRDAVWAWFVVRLATAERVLSSVLGGRMLRDLQRGATEGRFAADPHGLAPFSVGAVVRAAMRARLEGLVGADAPEEAAEQVLRLLGVPATDAAAVVRRPLPELGEAWPDE